MTRVFLGIGVPDDLAASLQRAQSELPMGRIVPPENLHLTLCFLGSQPDGALQALDEELCAIHHPAVEIDMAGLDWIGGAFPRGVAAGVVASDALNSLQKAVRGACHRAGIVVERRRFVPHVTLARLGQTPASAALNMMVVQNKLTPFGAFKAHEFTLYQSDLRPDGAVYTPLADYPLAP